MSVTLTQTAAERVSSHLATRDSGVGLRLSVKNSGCSGFAYQMDYATEITEDDMVFESRGVKVVVNEEHIKYLEGLEVDYVEDGLSCSFHFNNPNVTEQCGCGESFTVY
jgi:iron-sulfur cluster assembly protein